MLLGKEVRHTKEVLYLGQTLTTCATWSKHIKRRTKKAATWRHKAYSVARKHGRAPLAAEQMIREGGEKASGLFGAEAWCTFYGNRYQEITAKQGRIEREMLGMGKCQELWAAREEMGTESWAMEKFYLKMEHAHLQEH